MYRISSDHPSLSGHFPGSPIVPAVIILNHVLIHLKHKGLRVVEFDNVKFLAPLLPEQGFDIKLEGDGPGFIFLVLVQQKTITRGKIITDVID